MGLHQNEDATTRDDHAPDDRASRRLFLRRSAVVTAAVPGIVLAFPKDSQAAGPGSRHLPDLFPGWNRRNFEEILQDEQDHIVALTALADNPRPKPTFQGLLANTPLEFVQMAAMIENGGVGSYLQGLNAISQGGHHDYFLTAAGITAVEARHAAVEKNASEIGSGDDECCGPDDFSRGRIPSQPDASEWCLVT
jgi:hypothetical protein